MNPPIDGSVPPAQNWPEVGPLNDLGDQVGPTMLDDQGNTIQVPLGAQNAARLGQVNPPVEYVVQPQPPPEQPVMEHQNVENQEHEVQDNTADREFLDLEGFNFFNRTSIVNTEVVKPDDDPPRNVRCAREEEASEGGSKRARRSEAMVDRLCALPWNAQASNILGVAQSVSPLPYAWKIFLKLCSLCFFS